MGDDEAFILTGADAIKAVSTKEGAWNWCLIGADAVGLPLAGGGNGFVDEMRDCMEDLHAAGDSVLCGLFRMKFTKMGSTDIFSYKWVQVFATLDGAGMSAVQRGKALSNARALEKVFTAAVKCAFTMEITDAADLNINDVKERVHKVSILDGDLVIPEPTDDAPKFDKNRKAPEVVMDEEDGSAGASASAPPTNTITSEPSAAEEPAAAAGGYPTDEAPPAKSKMEMKMEEAQAKAAAHLHNEAEAAKPAPGAADASKASKFSKGDLVDIWSASENKWYTDGVIEDVKLTEGTTHEGKPLPAGCAKIVYSAGSRGKWLQPEALADKNVVKPSIKPAVFTGLMKKETHNIMSEWHNRYFELRDGLLTWWETEEDKDAGKKPQKSVELVKLQMKASANTPGATKFSIRTASSKGVVYNFDTATTSKTHSFDEWAAALKQHAAFANRMHKFRQGTK